jgi:hypothetical protein
MEAVKMSEMPATELTSTQYHHPETGPTMDKDSTAK